MAELVSHNSNFGPHQATVVIGSVCYLGAFGLVQIGIDAEVRS